MTIPFPLPLLFLLLLPRPAAGSSLCPGTSTTYTAGTGTLTLTSYPAGTCGRRLSMAAGSVVVLTIEDNVDLQNADTLSVFDGPDATAGQLVSVTGQYFVDNVHEARAVVSSGPDMYVQLTALVPASGKRLYLVWQGVPAGATACAPPTLLGNSFDLPAATAANGTLSAPPRAATLTLACGAQLGPVEGTVLQLTVTQNSLQSSTSLTAGHAWPVPQPPPPATCVVVTDAQPVVLLYDGGTQSTTDQWSLQWAFLADEWVCGDSHTVLTAATGVLRDSVGCQPPLDTSAGSLSCSRIISNPLGKAVRLSVTQFATQSGLGATLTVWDLLGFQDLVLSPTASLPQTFLTSSYIAVIELTVDQNEQVLGLAVEWAVLGLAGPVLAIGACMATGAKVTDAAGTLLDRDDASPQYQPDQNAQCIFAPPPGQLVQFVLTNFHTEKDTDTLAVSTGFQQYAGLSGSLPAGTCVAVPGPVVLMWTSGGGSGWVAEWTTVGYPQYDVVCFGDLSTPLTASSGELRDRVPCSPEYPPHADCTTFIAAQDPAKAVLVNFTQFATEFGTDVLAFYCDAAAHPFAEYSGALDPGSCAITPCPDIGMRWATDGAVQQAGWAFRWQFVDAPPFATVCGCHASGQPLTAAAGELRDRDARFGCDLPQSITSGGIPCECTIASPNPALVSWTLEPIGFGDFMNTLFLRDVGADTVVLSQDGSAPTGSGTTTGTALRVQWFHSGTARGGWRLTWEFVGSLTPTATPTPTATATRAFLSRTSTLTSTATATRTTTATLSRSPTATATRTGGAAAVTTGTPTPTRSAMTTLTGTPSRTATPSRTCTATRTRSATGTRSGTSRSATATSTPSSSGSSGGTSSALVPRMPPNMCGAVFAADGTVAQAWPCEQP